MNTLKIKGNDLINKEENELKQSYDEVFRQNRNKLIDLIDEIVSDYMRGLPTSKIEDIVDDFVEEMKIIGKQLARKVTDENYENYRNLLQKIEQGEKNKNTIFIEYFEDLKQTVKRTGFRVSTDDFNYLIQTIIKNVYSYCEPFMSMTSYRFDSMLEDMQYELKNRLKKQIIKIVQECNAKTIETIKYNLEETAKNIQNYELRHKDLTAEEVEKFTPVLEKNNYQLVKQDGKYYVKNLKNSKMYTFVIEGSKLILDGNKIEFVVDDVNALEIYADNERDGIQKKIISTKDQITTLEVIKANGRYFPKDETYEQTIRKTANGYEFIYNGKVYTDKLAMLDIAKTIASKAPKYYEEMLKDQEFSNLLNELRAYEKEQTEITTNKETGEIKINPNKMEKIAQKLSIFGYEMFDIDGEYYLKDLTTGEERKMITSRSHWGVGMEGIEAKELDININTGVVSSNNIITDLNVLKKGDISLKFRDSLKTFIVYIGKQEYKVKKTADGIECQNGLVDGTKINNEEMLQILNEKLPYLAKHLEEYLINVKNKTDGNTPPTR